MSFDITILFEKYKDAVKQKEAAENVIIFIEKEIDYLEEQLIYFMEISNISELTFDDDSISLKADVFPNVLVRNHPILKEFLGEDEKEVFSETPSKLRGYINKMIDDNKPIPEFINLFIKKSIKLKEEKKRGKKNGR